jgi:hypothetical protein
MKNALKPFGIITIAVIIGFLLISCGDGGTPSKKDDSGNPSTNSFDNLSKGIPNNTILSDMGIGAGKLNSIATGSGYKGYSYGTEPEDPSNKMLWLFYTSKTKSDFDSMKASLSTALGVTFTNYQELSESFHDELVYNTSYYCLIDLMKTEVNWISDFSFPAGTMVIIFSTFDF